MASHNIEQQELKANPKLFLDPTQNYAEIEWDGTFFRPDYLIEVPDGANFYCNGYFWLQLNSKKFWNGQGWQDDELTLLSFSKRYKDPIVWQRTQDEPFLTPESVVEREVHSKNVVQKVNEFSERLKKLEYQFERTGSSASGSIKLMPRNSVESISIHGAIESKLDLEPQEDALVGIDATLAERQSQYGSFEDVAFVTENIMGVLAKVRVNGLNDLPNPHRMALYMIASKMARIVNGDCNHKDSWHDIGGYAKLIENLIKD